MKRIWTEVAEETSVLPFSLQKKVNSPHLLSLAEDRRETVPRCLVQKSFCNLFCHQTALNSLHTNTASLSGMGALVKLFDINKQKKLRGAQTVLRVLE